MPLTDVFLAPAYDTDTVQARRAEVRHRLSERIPRYATGHFTTIAPADLEVLFDLYDTTFFQGGLRRIVGENVNFRLSRSHSRTHGRCEMREIHGIVRCTLVINATTLWNNFHEGDREVVASGVLCRDRLDGLQVIFEHEITHLVEFLVFGKSNCRAPRFAKLVRDFFAQEAIDPRSDFIVPEERVYVDHGIKAGDKVHFVHEGREFRGIVQRVVRRATVMVESEDGRYVNSEGKRFTKWYIPPSELSKIE